jgi:pimeloyl-ACP methyl ester carboxylesterase
MRRLLVALSMAIAGVACSAAAAPGLDLKPCQIPGSSETVPCAKMEVPEDWSRPEGRRIALNVIVMPKLGPGPEQAPMVWLEGGPGVPGTISAPLYSTELKFHRDRRAVVLFDMRGTGQSGALHCPKTEQRSALADVWTAADVTECRRELEAKADLSKYSTEAAARDVDALRAALGYDKIDLAALSYGTWLAQAYMKLYPARVRAAALIGTVPLGEKLPLHHAANGELALRQVFADCRADPACAAAFPHLAADWEAIHRRLDQAPIRIPAANGDLEVRQGPFGELVRGQLNTVDGQRRLPLLISRMARGDYGPLTKLVQSQGAEPEADGLYLSITCPEGTRRIRADEIAPAVRGSSFGRWRIDQQIAACGRWAPAKANPALLTPVRSQTPVLFLAGGRDATTPVFWARKVAAGLPNSRIVVIGPASHLPVGLTNIECLDRIADAFFAKASAQGLDTSCIGTMKPPPFVTSP